jgi:hypothetical protein
VAYTWSFTREALAGVTPIGAMIRDTDRPLERPGAAGALPRAGSDEGGRLRRLASPLLVSGASPRSVERLRDRLRPFGMRVEQGGGAGPRKGLEGLKLEPGSACAVDLMRGDTSWTVLGTVTAVEGKRVLAFGHSFFDSGERRWPLSTAWVNYTVGAASSFKMGETVRPVGALVQDRQAAVAGELGLDAPMIPAAVTVRNGITKREETLSVEIVQDPMLTSIMLGFLVGDALLVAESSMEPTRVDVDLRVKVAGREKPVVYRDVFTSSSGPSAFGASSMVSRILQNPYERVTLERIHLVAEVVHDEGSARIESVRVDRDRAAPGEAVQVRVTIRPRRGERLTHVVPVRVPERAVPGSVLHVRVMGGDDVSPDLAPADDLEGIIRTIEAFHPSTDLVAEVQLPRIDVTHRGRTVRGVPASVLEGLLPSSGTAPVGLRQATVRSRVATDHAIRGFATVQITVVDPRR